MANVIFKFGTSAQYKALPEKDADTLYWLSDTKQLYKGNDLYGLGSAATETQDGLFTAVEKKKLDALAEAHGISNLEGSDSITVEDVEPDGKKVSVKLDPENNAITSSEAGLKVENAVYSIENTGSDETYSAIYKIKRTVGEAGEYITGEINVPKDMVVQSGEIITATNGNDPVEGVKIGDKILKLVIANKDETPVYIPLKDLVDEKAYVVKEVTGADSGRALIFNESDGGGAKFYHKDGLSSFVGVHDGATGGFTGLLAQMNAVKDGKGTRLNLFEDKITYTNKASQKDTITEFSNDDYELVVKKDLNDLREELGTTKAEIEWEAIGIMTADQAKAAVEKVATETLGTYANITVTEGNITAEVKSESQDTDINVEFGVTLLKALKNSGFQYVAVSGHDENKIDLLGDESNFKTLTAFLADVGFKANKLKDLNEKTLDIVFTDIGGTAHSYHIVFSIAAAE